jgi:hypothetical protein
LPSCTPVQPTIVSPSMWEKRKTGNSFGGPSCQPSPPSQSSPVEEEEFFDPFSSLPAFNDSKR